MFPLGEVPPNIGTYIMSRLYRALPPAPPDATPETLEARDVTAMAFIARLCPVNTAEANLAVQAVAAQSHATDCLEAVSQHYDDFRKVVQCRAQSALMMRQSMQALRALRDLQECRHAALARKLAEIEAERRYAAEDQPAETAPVETEVTETKPALADPSVAATATAATTVPEPDPRPLMSDRRGESQVRHGACQRYTSHTTTQNTNQRNHETDSGFSMVPQRPRPSNAALIAALLPGTVRPGAERPA